MSPVTGLRPPTKEIARDRVLTDVRAQKIQEKPAPKGAGSGPKSESLCPKPFRSDLSHHRGTSRGWCVK